MDKLKLRFFQSFCKGFLGLALLCSTTFANAVIIESELTSLGGNSYQLGFSIFNNDIAAGIEEFTIYFDETLYTNLNSEIAPAGWDPVIVQPETDPLFFDPGFYDALADFGISIGINETLGGFLVAFDWIGGATGPSAVGNPFDIIDPNDPNGFFNPVSSGATPNPVVITPPNPIPEPGLLSLFGLALLFVGARKRFS